MDTIHACRSLLGWYLAGPMCKSVIKAKTENDLVTFAMAVVHEDPDVLEKHLNNLERYDFNDPVYSKALGRSRDDLRAQQIVDSSIHIP